MILRVSTRVKILLLWVGLLVFIFVRVICFYGTFYVIFSENQLYITCNLYKQSRDRDTILII